MNETLVVWKYPFEVENEFIIRMPRGAQVLAVQAQGNEACLWALVNSDNELEDRKFFVRGTGHPIRLSDGHYIGTFQLLDGAFVGHLFVEWNWEMKI
jgi:hypothetical protein